MTQRPELDAFILIDYDNLPQAAKSAGLPALARRLDADLRPYVHVRTDIRVRLYGGWYNATGLTNAGSLLAQEIGREFPIPLGSGAHIARRIYCGIATSLIDSAGDVFLYTMRQRRGMRAVLKSTASARCVNASTCTVTAVEAWSKGTCPATGCPVNATEPFSFYEQKLTDTLLCSDLLALAQRNPAPTTFILSDDDDMTPAILMAAKTGAPIFHIRSSLQPKFYDGILRQNSVQIITL